MWKWILGLLIVMSATYIGYDYYKAGYLTRPPLPDGAFSLSFRNGLRGIMVGLENAEPARRYLGIPAKVPSWYQQSWSTCRALTDDEKEYLEGTVETGPGSRWEAVCEIDADGEVFVRGWIASVPNV
ncbi:MAG: hypothetical protein KDK08_09795 [Rhizobiaceae bacterium]|nr:hypothetical protein [Rhizobiaceae bacterium]